MFFSLGGAIGAGIQVIGKENASHNYKDSSDVGPPALPYLEALLEFGYRF